MFSALADLVLARGCVGCAQPGQLICPTCWRQLPAPQLISGTPPIAAGSVYDGFTRSLVLAHKRSLVRSLALPLADLLDRGILIRETGPAGFLRVSAGTPEEMALLRSALDEIDPTLEGRAS